MKTKLEDFEERKTNWAGLCRLVDVLLWERYGYWNENKNPPDWYQDLLKDAKHFATIVKEPNCKYKITYQDEKNNVEVCGTFEVWDENNKWVNSWKSGFLYSNKTKAEESYRNEFYKHKRLHDGVIKSLIHYQKTKEVIPEDWLPESQKYWESKKYKRENHYPTIDGEMKVED